MGDQSKQRKTETNQKKSSPSPTRDPATESAPATQPTTIGQAHTPQEIMRLQRAVGNAQTRQMIQRVNQPTTPTQDYWSIELNEANALLQKLPPTPKNGAMISLLTQYRDQLARDESERDMDAIQSLADSLSTMLPDNRKRRDEMIGITQELEKLNVDPEKNASRIATLEGYQQALVDGDAGRIALFSRAATTRQPNRKPTHQVWNESGDQYIQQKAMADYEKFKARAATYGLADNRLFNLMLNYVQTLASEDQDAIDTALTAVLNYLDGKQAFQIRGETYIRTQADPAVLDRAVSVQSQRGVLWGKMSQYPAIADVQQKGGTSLESSVGGSLFDGLTFGRPRWSDRLRSQWREVSKRFVQHITHEAHVMLLEGEFPQSVFTTTEKAIIKEKMTKREIKTVYVYIYTFDKTRMQMVPKQRDPNPIPITDPAELDQLPKVESYEKLGFYGGESPVDADQQPTGEQRPANEIVDILNTFHSKHQTVLTEIKTTVPQS